MVFFPFIFYGTIAGHQQAASSVLHTTSCKHSLVFLKMDKLSTETCWVDWNY